MNIPEALVLFRSQAVTVRVEPPDMVFVEGLAGGPLSFRSADVRACRALLVHVYRERYDTAFEGRDDDLVIRLELEGAAPRLLGCFGRVEGSAIADAVELARRRLLFAMPNFSVSVSDDAASLVVTLRGPEIVMSVPVPASRLAELVVRRDARIEARHALATGLAVDAESRWVELVFVRERPWLLGPLSGADAARLALAFRVWRGERPLEVTPTVVGEAELLAHPSRWHMRLVDVTATWSRGFERSSFVNVWLEVPEREAVSYGTYRARVVGTWIYPTEPSRGGYGHMGCSDGMLRAETVEILEVVHRPDGGRDGLTGLYRRPSIDAAFEKERARAEAQPFCLALLDLDRFKRVNDTHGHPMGDEVLRRIANELVQALRPDDVVARWRADQFAVLLQGAPLEAGRELLAQALARIRALLFVGGEEPFGVTMSGGLIEVAHDETVGRAVERADRALYNAKRSGRDRLVTDPS